MPNFLLLLNALIFHFPNLCLPVHHSLSLSLFVYLALSQSLSLSPSVWGPLNCSSVKREGPSVLLHHPEKDWNWCVSDDRAPSVSVICAAQHHRLGTKSDINPLYVSRFGFQRKQLVSRANYLIGPHSLLAQELCKIDLHLHASQWWLLIG